MNRTFSIMSLGALVALAAAAPAAAQSAPVVHTVVKQVAVKQGNVSESKVTCPSTMAAIAGTVTKQPAGSALRRSLPSGVRTWRFGFSGGTKKATVAVRCVALNVPARAGKVKLNVNTVSRGFGVDALSTAPKTLDCSPGYVPTAWGFDISAPTVQVFKALASRTGYAFGVENVGAAGQVVKLRVRCLEAKAAGKAALSHRWRIKRQRYSGKIASGVKTVRHSCSAGYVSIGLGHGIDSAGDAVFRRSFDVRTGSGRWVFANARGTDTVTTQLLCLSTRTQFR